MDIDENLRPYMRTYPPTELKPYAEPVRPEQMHVGRVYFACHSLDPDMLVPELYPLIYLGLNLDGDDPDLRYFQHFRSYLHGVRYATRTDEDGECFEAYGPGEGNHIFEYEHALEVLMRCALDRRKAADVDQQILRFAEHAPQGGMTEL